MNTNNLFRVYQNVSKDPCFKIPKGIDYLSIMFRREWLTLDELIEKIKSRYYWAAIYNHYIYSKKSFESTHCMVFHMRNIFTMNEYIRNLEIDGKPLPTFSYEVGKDRYNNNIFKLVYVFDKQITADNFALVYNNLCDAIGYKQENDTKPGSMMIMKHCGCTDGALFRSNVIYKTDDFCKDTKSVNPN